jgi:hypothetical protein
VTEQLAHMEVVLTALFAPVLLPMAVLLVVAFLLTTWMDTVALRQRRAEQRRSRNLPFINNRECK